MSQNGIAKWTRRARDVSPTIVASNVDILARLRGGGACDHYLRLGNVSLLRRRGRWTSDRTLERYLQEGLYLSVALRHHLDWSLVESLMRLAPAVLT